jgi:hypothetical protein
LNGTEKPGELQQGDDTGFQPINKARGAAAGSTGGDAGSSSKNPGSSKASKKGPNPQKIDDEDGKGAGKAPPISIDEKVAWRSRPTRTRVETRSHLGSARLVRLPAYPQSEWLPVDSESKVANRK